MKISSNHHKVMLKDKLIAIQKDLAKRVELKDRFKTDRIAGTDIAYTDSKAICAAVVLDFKSLEVIKEKVIKTKVFFPYIPTFLAFREAKPIIKVLKGLDFDICILDGQGIAHPRGLGVASHVGVMLDVPTIGVAKNLLCGEVQEKLKIGGQVPIIYGKKQVGYAFLSKKETRPIYVSPGHRVSLKSSIDIVRQCIMGHKLPEPTRLAHILANSAKNR